MKQPDPFLVFPNYQNLLIGILVMLPGIYLLWFARTHPSFFEQRAWEKWRGLPIDPLSYGTYSIPVGWILRLIFRCGGLNAVKWSLQLFGVACIGIGLWAAFSP